MKIFLSGLLFIGCSLQAQTVSLSSELNTLADISSLPAYRSNTVVAQRSSYDTTGGNNDGFNGTYSFVRKNSDGSLVMFDVEGPGVINRIATPMAAPEDKNDYHKDTLDWYIDDNTKPAFSISFLDLFSGKVYPFAAPLSGTALGAHYSYLPVPFQKSCKIIYRGEKLYFHQIQYRLFPKNTKVAPFHLALTGSQKAMLNKVKQVWEGELQNNVSATVKTINYSIYAGDSSVVFNETKGGRITGIELNNNEPLDSSVFIRVIWDNENIPAIYCPLRDLFGYAFGKPAMKSLLLGGDDQQYYSRIPMPYDRAAKIELINHSASDISGILNITYTAEKRNPQHEGKLYVNYVDYYLDKDQPYHVFLDKKGKGHYIGTILRAQGIDVQGTPFFEGDDSTAIDNVFRIHGTGSEDYFGGGWYALKGRWDATRSLPIFGCLDYNEPRSFTGGYRFYLSDKLSFEKSIYQAIEHGPSPAEMPRVHYVSLAFYYWDGGKM